MAERIYTRAERGRLEPLEEKPFSTEDELQALIAEHPELLDGEQIRPGDPRRWILISREKGIAETSDAAARWAIDHLIIDQDAVPTLTEVKRGSNLERLRPGNLNIGNEPLLFSPGHPRGFAGVLTHNPLEETHGAGKFQTHWGHRCSPFSLDELSEVIPRGWRLPTAPSTEPGRNCALFRSLLKWAGALAHRDLPVLPMARATNEGFEIPLPDAEVASIARRRPLQARERDIVVRIEQPVYLGAAGLE